VTAADGSQRVLNGGEWKARGQRVTLVIDPVEADVIVRRIFEPYVRGKGLASIAAALNEAAIRPPDSNQRRGSSAWTKGSLWSILRNAAYVGTATYGKARYSEIGKKRGKVRRPTGEWVIVEGAVPQIVPTELWHAAQAKHGTRRFGIGRPWHRPYLLSG